MKKYILFAFFACFLAAQAAGMVLLADSAGKPQYLIETKRSGNFLGNIRVELFPIIAPLHVANFDSLVNMKFYDSTAFHRVIPGFVIQGGDPNSKHGPRATWGYGDPSQQTVPAEFSAISHLRGILSAARSSDPNSATSQFFICVGNPTHLDGNYSAYGRVIEGMNIVDNIVNSPRDGNDNPIEKIEMFITKTGYNDSVPAIPAQISPSDGEKGILDVHTFQWTPVAGAVMYHLQIATDTNFNNIVWESDVPLATQLIDYLQQGEVKHYWRVLSNNGGHVSDYSPIHTFTTAIEAPILSSPANNSTNQSLDPLLQWNAVSGAASYRLHVATSTAFTVGSTVVNEAGITATSYQLNSLTVNKKYYWKVKSATSDYEATFSPVWNFRTTTVSGLEQAGGAVPTAAVYPNPLNEEAIYELYLPQSSEVTIALFDALGRKIREENLGILSQGEHIYEFDAKELSEGLYFYTVEGNGFVLKGKFTVAR